jgi:hypothetical protein
VYELPVGTGRDDGAPRGGSSGTDSGASQAQPSSYRSENNFGTSAVVPGDPRTGRGGKVGAGAGKKGAAPVLAATVLETGETSVGRSYLLLALIAGVGVLLGVLSARRRAAD